VKNSPSLCTRGVSARQPLYVRAFVKPVISFQYHTRRLLESFYLHGFSFALHFLLSSILSKTPTMRSSILSDSSWIASFLVHLSLMSLLVSWGESVVISAKGALQPASNPIASSYLTVPFNETLGFGIGEYYCTRDSA